MPQLTLFLLGRESSRSIPRRSQIVLRNLSDPKEGRCVSPFPDEEKRNPVSSIEPSRNPDMRKICQEISAPVDDVVWPVGIPAPDMAYALKGSSTGKKRSTNQTGHGHYKSV